MLSLSPWSRDFESKVPLEPAYSNLHRTKIHWHFGSRCIILPSLFSLKAESCIITQFRGFKYLECEWMQMELCPAFQNPSCFSNIAFQNCCYAFCFSTSTSAVPWHAFAFKVFGSVKMHDHANDPVFSESCESALKACESPNEKAMISEANLSIRALACF